MEYTEQEWNGYRWLTFSFEDRQAMVLCPKTPDPQGRWLFKTEYFLAFPAFEEEMLARGFHVAWLENHSRWCLPEDIDVKPRFCDFLQKEFHLAEKCLPVGMSCGGMHAVYFAAKYPQYVAALYLDAPVINLLSCPCGVGTATDEMYPEFLQHTGMTVSQVLGCGIQKGKTEYYRGVPLAINLLPKVQVEIVVSKVPVEQVVNAARQALYTGRIGDGKIFVYDVENVIKVRTGEEGYDALQGEE